MRYTKQQLELRFELIKEHLTNEGYVLHHSSIARGYESVEGVRIESYEGRFGKGKILHLPTRLSNVRGNSHHTILYYIEA